MARLTPLASAVIEHSVRACFMHQQRCASGTHHQRVELVLHQLRAKHARDRLRQAATETRHGNRLSIQIAIAGVLAEHRRTYAGAGTIGPQGGVG